MKMSFIFMIIKKHFHKKGFALGLVLKQRLAASRKWPIAYITQHCARNNFFFYFFYKMYRELRALVLMTKAASIISRQCTRIT